MNSFWNKIFFFLMLLLTGNLFSQETDAELEKRLDEEHRAREEYSTYINEVEEAFSEQMKKELNIYWSGINDTRHAKIEDLGMQLVAKRRATVEEARAFAKGGRVISQTAQVGERKKEIFTITFSVRANQGWTAKKFT